MTKDVSGSNVGLLPCPFCGDHLALRGDYNSECSWNYWEHPHEDSSCILKDLRIDTQSDMKTPNVAQASAWNTRQQPNAASVAGDALIVPREQIEKVEQCRKKLWEIAEHYKTNIPLRFEFSKVTESLWDVANRRYAASPPQPGGVTDTVSWFSFAMEVGKHVGCLASSFPDGNQHIIDKIAGLAAPKPETK